MLLFWGCDAETTPLGVVSHMPSRLCYWFTDLGIESVYVCPDLNYAAAVHADKWIPILPNTDAALQLAIAYVWLTEGTYDKEYIAQHAHRSHKEKPYRRADRAEAKADRANLRALDKTAQHHDPQFSSNPYSRWQQKQAIKRE